jgi:hypothetical protein
LYEQITAERLLEHLQGFEVEQFIFSRALRGHLPVLRLLPEHEIAAIQAGLTVDLTFEQRLGRIENA